MDGLLGAVEQLADQGSHELAADIILTLLLKDHNPRDWTSSTALRAGQAAYLLALHLVQVGSTRPADALLRCLGCTLRLADAVLIHKTGPPLQTRSKQSLSLGAWVLPAALPEGLFRQLREVFSPEAPFWQQTGYNDPDHPFFSFLYELGDPAHTAVEAAIHCCKECLSRCGHDMSRVEVAEWWAHKRAATDAHQLHFDLDETRIGSGSAKYKLRHPAYSTVLYLSDCGGPTVVLNQTASSAPAQDAWLCWPRENQLLCFPGNFLHGVIPGMPPEQDAGGQRITLVVVFWEAKLRPQPGAPGSGPMRALPGASSARSFLGHVGSDERGAQRQIHRSEWKAAQHVKRPWKDLTAETGQEQSRGPAAARGAMQPQIPLPPLRFFLLSPEEISDIYQPQYQRQAL
ncbi:g11587 [Coccomyxa viridis]|uniref:G11587 protein n=1 Tax=Coccomyxa viridis TaxID=1274662 RepID=A0ABP1GB00_9CHLO